MPIKLSAAQDDTDEKTRDAETTPDTRPWLKRYRFPKGHSGNPGGKRKSTEEEGDDDEQMVALAIRVIRPGEVTAPALQPFIGRSWAEAAAALLAAFLDGNSEKTDR